ncbi:MAG: hypothetical protein EOL90_11470 [Spartobacteria bacterium]|nr:hypothetical protein [Spartobacteria bacterium]
MSKKDALRQAFNTDKQPSNRTAERVASTPEFTPIEPMSLSTSKRTAAPEPAEQSQQVKRAYNTAKLPRAKHGVIRTKRHSFEITPELHKEMLQTLAKYTADTGDKITASEFIRKAIAREIREFKR